MFDEDDYISDEEQNLNLSFKHNPSSSRILVPSSASDFNHLTGEGESLIKLMKDRGFDLTDNQIKKMKEPRRLDKSLSKPKQKAGFFDGGDKASLQQLMKALNKAFSKADPHQASCILSYILQKKNLSREDRNKFGIMKCNILFGLGAYEDCLSKTLQFIQKPYNKLSGAILSNLAAKCKGETGKILSGYMDLLRAKSLIEEARDELFDMKEKEETTTQKSSNANEDFNQTQIDITVREIMHTQLEYNIKMVNYKNNTNLIYPYFPEFRHRKIVQVACGDYHTLFLVAGSISNREVPDLPNWECEIFGIGEDTVGQISGREKQIIYKQPMLVSELSGKGIKGIWASKQSSLAYDQKGNIYEWGVKQKRNSAIEVTYTIGQQITRLEKGYKHYACQTKSGKFYSWGKIQTKGAAFYNQPKPHMENNTNIVSFSCGSFHTIAVDKEGFAYALGNNDVGQLGIPGDRVSKNFKKINNFMIADITKVFCLGECSFFVNSECEMFYCGKHSYKKQFQEKIRQAEFSTDFKDIICVSGSTGNYYVTNEMGQVYRWEVDSMVKFKHDKEFSHVSQRYVIACKGSHYRVKSTIKPSLCTIERKTTDLRSYEPISYDLVLKDEFGLFGVKDYILAQNCQIFLSTYKMKQKDLLNENQLFLENYNFSADSSQIVLSQIVQSRLCSFQLTKNQQNPWLYNLEIVSDSSGKFYFYVVLEDKLILQQELQIEISLKEKQLEEKNRLAKQLREEERRRRAELERQRLAEEKMRKEMEEDQRRKETQKRAEQALKKHMREQEEAKMRQEEERKAKKELLTGGGFDLNKMKRKNSSDKAGQTFLPDINQRPSSRKKINLPKPSELIGMVKPEKTMLNTGGGWTAKNEISTTTMAGFTSEKSGNIQQKLPPQLLSSTGSGSIKQGRNLMKRPSSKKK